MEDFPLHAGLAEEGSGLLALASITTQHSAAHQKKTFVRSRDITNDATRWWWGTRGKPPVHFR